MDRPVTYHLDDIGTGYFQLGWKKLASNLRQLSNMDPAGW